MSYKLHHGDCIDIMASLPAESVDAIVTSPPYAEQRKSTYGGIPESDYPAWTVAWMAEAKRLLKPNGSVIINIRPHIKNGQISDYTLRTRLALRDAAWCEVDELIWFKSDSIPTGSPRKPRRSWESLHWFAKHGQPWSDAKANGSDITRTYNPVGSHSSAHSLGWSHTVVQAGGLAPIKTSRSRCRDVADIPVGKIRDDYKQPGSFRHPAPFSTSLAEWCGKLICPPDGTILDPFSGSGSTGIAALRNGWDYIGIEAVEEYAEMSRQRLEMEESSMSGHHFIPTECHWNLDPEVDPDIRMVCIDCGLDKELGDNSLPCAELSRERLAAEATKQAPTEGPFSCPNIEGRTA